jgi:8-hydroxy-5-deazaflavin:NADPH oxidoreductase
MPNTSWNWAGPRVCLAASPCLFRVAAKAIVLKLINELGFDAVDAGGLDESWRQQPGTPVYTEDFDADGVRRALAKATKDRTAEWRATNNSPGSFTAPA